MLKEELNKLCDLSALKLSSEEEGQFLEYFHDMKEMFDDFVTTSFEVEEDTIDEKFIQCFMEEEDFLNVEGILANVEKERLIGNAIEVKSAFGE